MAEGVTDTETAILDAALTEVLAHGVRRTTASDIARRAGVSRQTLYRYWPDVQALFAGLVTRELVGALPVDTAPPASLDAVIELLVATADAVRGMPLVDRIRESDPELFARYVFERLGTSQRAIHAALVVLFRDGQGAGIVRDGDPAALAGMVLLIAQSAVQSAPLVDEWLPGAVWRDELARALRGYLARTPS